MTPHDLIAAFDVLAEAPGGVNRLRELVRQLAVRGKLLPQDPDDEPASVLLEHLRAERVRLVTTMDARNATAASGSEGTLPCELPNGWSAARLSDLGVWLGGKTPSMAKAAYWTGGIPWVSPKDMKVAAIRSSEDEVSPLALSDGLSLVPAGSLLVVVRSGILRHTVPVALAEVDCTINQDLKALVLCPSVNGPFLRLLVQGFQAFILERLTKTGTTVESMKFPEFAAQPFPFPPLAEQHRIVARVDELMGLLNRLEAARSTRDHTRAALRDSALDALRESDTRDEVEAAWQRLAEWMDDLLADPADVGPLRQTVLQLAIRGRLVPQDPADEPASSLLRCVAAEKARLAEAGKIPRPKTLPPVRDDEVPFEIPKGWRWCRVGDSTLVVTDGEHQTPPRVPKGPIPLVTAKNVRDGYLDLATTDFVELGVAERSWGRCRPQLRIPEHREHRFRPIVNGDSGIVNIDSGHPER